MEVTMGQKTAQTLFKIQKIPEHKILILKIIN